MGSLGHENFLSYQICVMYFTFCVYKHPNSHCHHYSDDNVMFLSEMSHLIAINYRTLNKFFRSASCSCSISCIFCVQLKANKESEQEGEREREREREREMKSLMQHLMMWSHYSWHNNFSRLLF